jgi:hypothetical protein
MSAFSGYVSALSASEYGATAYGGTSLIRKRTPLGPPYDPRYRLTVGSCERDVPYERGTPVRVCPKRLRVERHRLDSDGSRVRHT